MIRFIIYFILSLSLSLAISSCSSSGGGDSATTTKVVVYPKSYDLLDAEALYITSDTQATTSPSFKKSYSNIGDITTILNKIKVLSDDSVVVEPVEVVYEEVEVSESAPEPSYVPFDSVNINNEYFLSLYNDGNTTEADTAYIVRKSDGFSSHNIGKISENLDAKIMQSDQYNNFYALTPIPGNELFNNITKFSLNNDGSYNTEYYSDFEDYVNRFVVDKDGNVVYQGYNHSDVVVKYLSASGTSYDIYDTSAYVFFYFIDMNGDIVYSYTDDATGSSFTKKVNPLDRSLLDYGSPAIDGIIISVKFIKNKNMMVTENDNVEDTVYPTYYISIIDNNQIVNNINAKTEFSIEYYELETSDDFLYLAGWDPSTDKHILIKINPTDTTTFETLLEGYDIRDLSVSPLGEVYFKGYRASDYQEVIGRISSTGVVSIELILDEDVNSIEAIGS